MTLHCNHKKIIALGINCRQRVISRFKSSGIKSPMNCITRVCLGKVPLIFTVTIPKQIIGNNSGSLSFVPNELQTAAY